MKFTSTQFTGLIAADYEASIRIFEKHGINYYSEGDRTLWTACLAAGVPVQTVLDELETMAESGGEACPQEACLNMQSTPDLIDHILKVHHEYTRAQLGLIGKLLNSGPNRDLPSYPRADELFMKFSDDFWRHMQWEEQVVFPHLIEVDSALRNGSNLSKLFKTKNFAENPIQKLLSEHGMMEREFVELSELVSDLPEDDPFRCALKDLGVDNRQHLHLENQILVKRAEEQGLLDSNPRPWG